MTPLSSGTEMLGWEIWKPARKQWVKNWGEDIIFLNHYKVACSVKFYEWALLHRSFLSNIAIYPYLSHNWIISSIVILHEEFLFWWWNTYQLLVDYYDSYMLLIANRGLYRNISPIYSLLKSGSHTWIRQNGFLH